MVKILSDSSCDLTKELLEEFGINTIPFNVLLGDDEHKDGVDLNSQMIIDYVEKTGVLPKTSAINEFAFEEFFKKHENKDGIICFTISSKISVTYANACKAAEKFDNVRVIDSRSLSTGVGIQAIYASMLSKKGYTLDEIVEKVVARQDYLQVSFATYKLNYLHKGGRCSSIQLLGANLLKIRPSIILRDGKMEMHKKYMGNMSRVCEKYVSDTLTEFSNINKKLVFITHSPDTIGVEDMVRKELDKHIELDRVEVTSAGATITSHCGENTIGLIYYNDDVDWEA